jgi:energy-coupling factor transport system ATP-binding protein
MNVEFGNVSFQYVGNRPVIQNLSFAASSSDFLLIVGQNGVGKSTLLKLLNGILKPSAGRIQVSALDTLASPTSRLAGEICVTFQNPADQIFASTVRQEIEFAPRNLRRDNLNDLVGQAMALCDLTSVAEHHPYDLPAAQRKLLTVASAIASGARFLAFDEPSAGLSQIERKLFENIVATMKKESRGLIVVSHDLGLFHRYATKVLILARGELVFFGNPEEVIGDERHLRRAGLRLPLPLRLRRIMQR